MLPIYISYFAGGGERTTGKTLKGALGFVTGFTVVFVALGALAGTAGSFLREYQTAVNIVTGLVVVFFGLNFLGVFKLNLFRGGGKSVKTDNISPSKRVITASALAALNASLNEEYPTFPIKTLAF